MTNNVAEFSGMLLVLEWLTDNPSNEPIHIFADSEIVIRRMKGASKKPPVGSCAQIATACRDAVYPLHSTRKITFEWRRRLHNAICDRMCTEKIKQAVKEGVVASPQKFDSVKPQGSFCYGDEVLG
jgi:ribonuclease HI